jgi:AAHS family 4-hydroxybenzoate transporter-like MFS transporter
LYSDARFLLPQVETRSNSIIALLAPQYRRTTLTVWVASFLSLFCIFGLTGWIPTVMIQRGETFAASFGFGALMQIMSFIGGLVCGYYADRIGSSRWTLTCWWALGGVAVLTLIFFNIHALNFVCIGAAGFFIIGAQYVLNNFTASSYATNVRATGVGMLLSVGRVGAILGPFVVGALQQIFPGPTAMFIAIGGAALVAAATIASVGSERSMPKASVASGAIAHG